MEERTADSVIGDLTDLISRKVYIPREKWLEAAHYLTLFTLEEGAKEIELEQKTATKQIEIKNGGKSVAASDIEIKTTPEWREWKLQSLKTDVMDKLVMVAKKSADY